jgi:hypothetical protein
MRKPMILALAGLALTLGACDSGSGSGPDGPARVTVMLTDNPGDVINVWVEIKEVYLQGGPDGRTVLATFDPAVVKELTSLANTATELVGETEIPEGSYSELRFVLGDACLEAETAGGGSAFYASDIDLCPEGTTSAGSLQMPSLGQSGLKVKFDGALEFSGGPTTLLVDFDVAESFGKPAGNSGKWVMHPVIKGATLKDAGAVKVTLAPATCVGFKAELIADGADAGEQLPFTLVGDPGVMTALYKYVLPGDNYKVRLVVPSDITTVPAPVPDIGSVIVTAKDTTPVAFNLTSCTPK